MKKFSLFLIVFIFLLLSCKEEANTNEPLANCIDDIITAQAAILQTVRRMEVNNENHYWLNTGDLAWDGPEVVVNESCDTVCVFCFCPPQPCHDDYLNGEWELYWEP